MLRAVKRTIALGLTLTLLSVTSRCFGGFPGYCPKRWFSRQTNSISS